MQRVSPINRKSPGDRVLVFFAYLLTGVFALLCLMPLWMALCASLTNENTLVREGYSLLIRDFDLTAYRLVFTGTDSVLHAYLITIVTTAAGTLLTLFMTGMLAYPLSVKSVKYRGAISMFMYFTMLFNGGLVANYILISRVLGLRDSIWVLIIPGCLSAYNTFLMRNYFQTIPEALAESAKIDGATDLQIFFRIILPCAKPILATIGLFAAMNYWNEWYKVLLYIDDSNLFTLQFLIMKLQRQVDFLTSSMGAKAMASMGNVTLPTVGVRMATAMVTIGPIVLLYPFLQKYFIKGITIGSVKG